MAFPLAIGITTIGNAGIGAAAGADYEQPRCRSIPWAAMEIEGLPVVLTIKIKHCQLRRPLTEEEGKRSFNLKRNPNVLRGVKCGRPD